MTQAKETSKTVLRKETFILLFFLSAVVFVAFSPALKNQFTNWDDDKYVTENKAIQNLSLGNLRTIFTSVYTKTYCPLTILSFALEYHFFQLNALYYILDNIFIHIAVVMLIFIFGLQLGLNRTAAFVGALLFGLHPMRVESIAWVTERKDVLYSFFYMISVCGYMKYLKTSNKNGLPSVFLLVS